MDYKVKLLELLTACINNQAFYYPITEKLKETIIFRNDNNLGRGLKAENTSFMPTKKILYEGTWKGDWRWDPQSLKDFREVEKKHVLLWASTFLERQDYPSIKILFEESPELSLSLSAESSPKEELVKYIIGKFWWKREMEIKKVTTYTYEYVLQHGSLKASLTLEEADRLVKLYQENIENFRIKAAEEQLEKRINKYKTS